jgi:2,4-dienoyl-CoA reductase-like NADH-dependent reductase (Old Yellow Enzyme family)
MKNNLFLPLTLREVTFKNRIFMSPMCMYSAEDGKPTAWHPTHYGSRAVGGAACILQEATAVLPEGRISPADMGLWNDEQAEACKPLVQFIKENGAIPGIQLAHAGRKASTSIPWQGTGYVKVEQGGWQVGAPSAVPFDDKSPLPMALTEQGIQNVIAAFAKAAGRALAAGYEVVEIHAAHGYLLHEFLSPLSNQRTDNYGGTLENRMRLALEVAEAVRKVWPERLPLFIRLSATDWVDKGGWDVAQTVTLCGKLKDIGVDLIDVSTGGLIPGTKIPSGPGYQVPFAEAIRQGVQIPVSTVGRITNAEQAEQIIANHQADVVMLGRELLRDPYWPVHAAHTLSEDVAWPKQYVRAKI